MIKYLIIVAFLSFDFFFGFTFGAGTPLGCLFALFLSRKYLFQVLRKFQISLMIYLFLLFYVFAGVVVSGGQISFLFTMIKVGLVSLSVPVLVGYVKDRNESGQFLGGAALAWAFQAAIVIASFSSEGVRSFGGFFRPPQSHSIYTTIEMEGTLARLYPASGQLVSGLAAVAAVFFCFFFWSAYHEKRGIRWNVLGMLSCFIVGGVSGRTFYIGIALSLIFVFFLKPRLAIGITLLIGAFLGAMSYILIMIDPKFAFWALEPLFNLFSGGGFSSRSTDALMSKHYFIPRLYDILVPSFVYKTAAGWAAGTDSGFLRFLLFGGPMLLLQMFLGFYFSLSRRFSDKLLPVLFTMVLLVVVTVKQETLTNASMVAGLLFLNAFSFGSNECGHSSKNI